MLQAICNNNIPGFSEKYIRKYCSYDCWKLISDQRRMEKQMKHILVVFDFDQSLVEGNTDTWIAKLSKSAKRAILERGNDICWTDVMQSVFSVLYQEQFSRQDYEECFKSLDFIEGMKETLDLIHRNNIPCIIISDSNSYFIDHLLNRDGLNHVFCEVFTNPAEWKDNCLHVQRYHSHTCSACPDNLCKKEVLVKFKREYADGFSFDHILYIGDGRGDLCPSLSLSNKDYILAREGYKLLELLRTKQSKNSSVDATIVPWNTGYQVLEVIRKVLGEK